MSKKQVIKAMQKADAKVDKAVGSGKATPAQVALDRKLDKALGSNDKSKGRDLKKFDKIKKK